MTGVYKILNKKNGRAYIGCSKDCEKRFGTHKSMLKHNNHHNAALQEDYNRQNKKDFDFVIVQECSIPDLTKEERDIINASENPYNFIKQPVHCEIRTNTLDVSFEQLFAKVIEKQMTDQKLSMYELMRISGTAQHQIDAVLQRKQKEGKTYTVHTLRQILDALGMKSITMDLNGNIVTLKFKQ